jgi:hypothetical protein
MHMATRKQRAANRRNAQLSTGPKTPEGKAAVRRNALKHGLTAENAVITAEEVQDFDQLRRKFEDHLQPDGPVEIALVQQIVMAQWRLVRLRYIETGLFNHGVAKNRDYVEEHSEGPSHAQTMARAFSGDTYTFSKFGYYETRTERAFYRALHELQRLQAARKTNSVEQTQPASETQPNPLPQNGLTPTAPRNGNAEIAPMNGENANNRVGQTIAVSGLPADDRRRPPAPQPIPPCAPPAASAPTQ